ncbi:MAG: hypothetical protein ACT4QB_15280 [Gammaproteobacteria bacterium]
MRRFVEPPASGGLRIPVFFTPDRGDDLPPELNTEGGLNLDAAEHTSVVVLGDERMLRTVPNGTGDAWVAFVRRAIGDFISMAQMGLDIAVYGSVGLATGLNNGLAEAENRELIHCTDPQRITGLVLTGLGRLQPGSHDPS